MSIIGKPPTRVRVDTLADGDRFWAGGRLTRHAALDEPGLLAAVPADGGAMVWYRAGALVTPKTDGAWLK